jgi:hypothetical protein
MPTVNDEYKGGPLSDAQLKAMATANYQTQAPSTTTSTYTGPTEIIELPSKGIPYPEGHPLKSGKLEMKYMTAKEEDILTNQSYIKQGVVLDKLFQALIVTPFDYGDLLIGDKNAVMVAARVLGYGAKYETEVNAPSGNKQVVEVDLTQLKDKEIDWDLHTSGKSQFEFELPASKHKITVKLITQADNKKIDAEITGLSKVKKEAPLTTRLKYMITAVDDNTESAFIRKFVDTELLAIDSRAIRNFLNKVTPDVELKIDVVDEATGEPFSSNFTIGLDFFWPDAEI